MLNMQDFLNRRDLHLLPTKRPGSGCCLITWLIFCRARLHLNLPFTERFFSVTRIHSCRRSNGYFAKEFQCSRALIFVWVIVRKKSFFKGIPSLKMSAIGCSGSGSISSNQPSKLNHAELCFFFFILIVHLTASKYKYRESLCWPVLCQCDRQSLCWLVLHQCDTRQSHFGRGNLKCENAPSILACGQD